MYSVYSVYRMEDRVGGRGGAGGEAEASPGSTERKGMTREERKLVAAVEISQKLEKDRQRKQDQASKGKEAAGKRPLGRGNRDMDDGLGGGRRGGLRGGRRGGRRGQHAACCT